MLTAGNLFYKLPRIFDTELVETQCVEHVEVALRVMRGSENLSPQAGYHIRELRAIENAQDLGSQNHGAVHVFGELCSIKHYKGSAESGRHPPRRAQTEPHKGLIVIAEALARISFNQFPNPLEVGWRRQFQEVLQG